MTYTSTTEFSISTIVQFSDKHKHKHVVWNIIIMVKSSCAAIDKKLRHNGSSKTTLTDVMKYMQC